MAWVGWRLKYLQSWVDARIPLNPTGLTVIKAASETGKSVPWKCIRFALFWDSYTMEEREVIVRRGHKEGYFTIELDDGSEVEFTYGRSRLLTRILEDGNEVYRYEGPIQNNVLEKLNLVVNFKEELVLNIIDNESPLAFDSTDPAYNDKILGFYADHEDLLNREGFLKEVLPNINKTVSNYMAYKKVYESRLEQLYIPADLGVLEYLQTSAESISADLDILESFEIVLSELLTLLDVGTLPTVDVDSIADMSNTITYMTNLEKVIKPSIDLDAGLNTVGIDFIDSLDNYIAQIEVYKSLHRLLRTYLDNFDEVKPVVDSSVLIEFGNISRELDLLKEVSKMIDALIESELVRLATLDTGQLDELAGYNHSIEIFDEIISLVSSCNDIVLSLDSNRAESRVLLEQYNSLANIVGVCSVCGNEIKEVDSL